MTNFRNGNWSDLNSKYDRLFIENMFYKPRKSQLFFSKKVVSRILLTKLSKNEKEILKAIITDNYQALTDTKDQKFARYLATSISYQNIDRFRDIANGWENEPSHFKIECEGVIKYLEGNYEEAMAIFLDLASRSILRTEVYFIASREAADRGNRELISHFPTTIFAKSLSDKTVWVASHAVPAIYSWLEYDLTNLHKIYSTLDLVPLPKTKSVNNLEMYFVFIQYILILVINAQSNPHNYTRKKLKPIYFIGESHSLSPHGLGINYLNKDYLAQSKFIFGLKIWHLVDSRKREQKYRFEKLIENLKEGPIVMCVGEIDLRYTGGIYAVIKKQMISNMQAIKPMVDKYLNLIQELDREIIVCGIQAPNYKNKIPIDEQSEFAALVFEFNSYLAATCRDKGIKYLDLYKETVGSDGYSNKSWHIDQYHLSSSLYKKLLSKL